MTKAKITDSAPVLLVKDVVKSAAYWRDKLGFTEQSLFGQPTNFAIIRRDSFTVMLAQVEPEQTFVSNYHVVEKMWDVYFWVDDADAIYAEFQASGAMIDYSLYIAPHGVKEFGVQDLDDHDIAFGQVIR
ncbi:MAG: bleomycin resistance protein [Anaerolineae bacterium]|nr:bleomycin resistance protein [Anaerolineae bacterium]